MSTVKIMRGLPGSGKSTWVFTQFTNGKCPKICSADFYHMKDGKYQFDISKIGAAHMQCFTEFVQALQSGKSDIVVDNTNTDPVEIAPYYKLAEYYRYDVSIVVMDTPIEICVARQTHGVPLSTMVRMWCNMNTKPLPPYWNTEVVK